MPRPDKGIDCQFADKWGCIGIVYCNHPSEISKIMHARKCGYISVHRSPSAALGVPARCPLGDTPCKEDERLT